MVTGASDHHLPIEPKLDEVIDKLGDVVDDVDTNMDESVDLLILSLASVRVAINTLKLTLTNLNVMPPVAETPWAFKLIGKAGFANARNITVTPLASRTLIELTGSGQTLSIALATTCTQAAGRQEARFRVSVDDGTVQDCELREIFCNTAIDLTPVYGSAGVVKNDADGFTFYWNIPIHYSENIKVWFTNRETVQDATISYYVSYTNLP